MEMRKGLRNGILLCMMLLIAFSLFCCVGKDPSDESTEAVSDGETSADVSGAATTREETSNHVTSAESEEPSRDASETDATAGEGDTTANSATTEEGDTTAETTEEETTEEEITREDLFGLDIPEGEYTLTFENLNVLGSQNNVVVFIIDRFDWEYYDRARREAPEIFYNLDNGGFTYFNDSMSLYPRTFPSIPYLITGVENDFTKNRNDYFASAYASSEYMRALYNAGYDINVYTDTYYGYTDAVYMANYAQNAKNIQEEYTPYTTDMKQIYSYLTDEQMTVGEGRKSYKVIHLLGTHVPIFYDEDFNALSENDPKRYNTTIGLKQSFAIINRYIDEMKRLGVYENSTIIITGDHTSIGSDSAVPLRWAHVTPMFVKSSANGSGELVVSGAPVSHADMFPTILKSEGFRNYTSFGESVFDISETEKRGRLYYFQKYEVVNDATNYEMVIFKVWGKAADYGNWEIIDRYYLGKSIYK